MDYANEKLGVKFTVADTITVRKQLAYMAARQFIDDAQAFEAHWRAAVPLLEGWACEALPNPKALDLDAVTDKQVTSIVLYTAGVVAAHMAKLESVPKA